MKKTLFKAYKDIGSSGIHGWQRNFGYNNSTGKKDRSTGDEWSRKRRASNKYKVYSGKLIRIV